MSKRSLPTETLEHIFSSNVEQRELALLCRASQRFYNIVKPFLYRSITLQSIRQAGKFKKSREEDVKLLRSVKVVGKENPWIVHDFTEVLMDFIKSSPAHLMGWEAGCVKRLLEGNLLKISNLTSIHIHNVLEDPRSVRSVAATLELLPFGGLRNLVELSVVSHRGGSHVIGRLLKQDVLPNLKRLTLCDVSSFKLVRRQGNLGRSENIVESPCSERRLLSTLPILQQLELLVCPSYGHSLSTHKYLHLAVLIFSIDRASSLDRRKRLSKSNKYAVLYIAALPKYFKDFEIIFEHFAEIASNYSSYSLKYLALPARLERLLWARERMILDRLTDLGVSVHFDGDLGSVIAPPSFFQFRKKEEEEEEEERRREEKLDASDRDEGLQKRL